MGVWARHHPGICSCLGLRVPRTHKSLPGSLPYSVSMNMITCTHLAAMRLATNVTAVGRSAPATAELRALSARVQPRNTTTANDSRDAHCARRVQVAGYCG